MLGYIDELKQLVCSDIAKALATYVYIESSSDYLYTNVVYTLRFLGLSSDEAEKLYNVLTERIGGYLKSGSYEELRAKEERLKEVVRNCLAELNIVEEARKRIAGLSDEDREMLQIAALGIVKRAEKGVYDMKRFNSVDLANFVSAMLSRNVSSELLEGLFIRTLLAVRSHSASRRYYYPTMVLVPNTVDLIKELAHAVESEWPSYDYIYSKLRYGAEPYQIAALCDPDESFYRAVYGYRVGDVLSSMVIGKIVFRGAKNRYVDEDLRKAIKALAQEYSHNLVVNYIINALEDVGYEVDLKHSGFLEFNYCCRYTAMRPGTALYIYVCPFAVRSPDVGKDEKAIVVVEGVGAKIPEYLEELRKDSWHAHLVNALWLCIHKHRVYVFETTIREDWQKEIVNALKKSYSDVHVVGVVEAVKERPFLPTLIVEAPPLAAEEVSTSIPSGAIQSREVLESIVAQALRALGFTVQTNVRKLARRGASIEVDVWAEKRVGDARFKVYVSCKNWNRDVDRSVVDEEFGRVFNLQEVPHLRVLVVKSMSRPAKEVAEADGFFVIELSERATKANAREVYELIYKKLSDLFTNIAPPQLLEIAKRVSETAKELSKIAQELARLSQGYK